MKNTKGMIPVMALNVALWLGIAAVGGHSGQAHAISAAYRAQLERTHTTQVQDAHGYTPAHKVPAIHVNKFGVDFKRGTDGIAYIDGKAAYQAERTDSAVVYQAGVFQVIVRNNHHIDLMQNESFKGHMR